LLFFTHVTSPFRGLLSNQGGYIIALVNIGS